MNGTVVRRSTLPGFGLTMGLTLTWLSVIILIPLAGLFLKTFELSFDQFWGIATSRRTLNALKISFGLSFAAALVNLVMGTVIVWALVRYRFPGRRLFDAIVDIPFALPTAVAGIALSSLFAQQGWLGAPLAELGIKVAFTPLGIFVAMIFIGFPFVVRTVQPVLLDLEPEIEEAAASLGANRWHVVTRVILPSLTPAILTEFYNRMQSKGITVDRKTYDNATRYVSRTIDQRVAHYAFGDSTAKRRDLPFDSPLRKSIELLDKASSQHELFAAAGEPLGATRNAATNPALAPKKP